MAAETRKRTGKRKDVTTKQSTWTSISHLEAITLYILQGDLRLESPDGLEYWERIDGVIKSNSPGGLISLGGPAFGKNYFKK